MGSVETIKSGRIGDSRASSSILSSRGRGSRGQALCSKNASWAQSLATALPAQGLGSRMWPQRDIPSSQIALSCSPGETRWWLMRCPPAYSCPRCPSSFTAALSQSPRPRQRGARFAILFQTHLPPQSCFELYIQNYRLSVGISPAFRQGSLCFE